MKPLFLFLFAACASTPQEEASPLQEEEVSIPTPVGPPPMQLELADLSSVSNGRWVSKTLAVGGRVDPAAFGALAEGGLDRVVNLQRSEEMPLDERGPVEAAGLVYFHLPIGSPDDFSSDWLAQFDALLQEEQTTLVHCASGNRVGAAFALHAHAHGGASPEEALEIGKNHGLTGLEPAVRVRLGL